MKVEIFYLDSQEPMVTGLEPLLQRRLFPNVKLNSCRINLSHREQALGVGRRYVRLLHASLPSTIALNVGYMEGFGQRLYIEMFLPFQYYSDRYSFGNIDVDRPRLEVFFPALAINGRMVLVPPGIIRQIIERFTSPFETLEPGAILETDFSLEPQVDEALAHLARTMRGEFLAQLRSYASQHRWQEINLARLARDLEVAPDFLETVLGPGTVDLSHYRQIRCSADRDRVSYGRWTKLVLTISNDSDIDLPELRVKVSGPVRIEPQRLQARLPARSMQPVAFAIMPEERGDFPLEISLQRPEDDVLQEKLPVHHVWLLCD